jgi:hypothetical protein
VARSVINGSGKGADKRVSDNPALKARDGAVQNRQQHAENLAERVLAHHRPDRVHQRARAEEHLRNLQAAPLYCYGRTRPGTLDRRSVLLQFSD